eukprot:1193147-Prorocentrum_minimum.AAC.1
MAERTGLPCTSLLSSRICKISYWNLNDKSVGGKDASINKRSGVCDGTSALQGGVQRHKTHRRRGGGAGALRGDGAISVWRSSRRHPIPGAPPTHMSQLP